MRESTPTQLGTKYELHPGSGHRTVPQPSISDIRQRTLSQIGSLPDEFKRLRNPEVYRVLLSETIGRWKEDMLENPDLA